MRERFGQMKGSKPLTGEGKSFGRQSSIYRLMLSVFRVSELRNSWWEGPCSPTTTLRPPGKTKMGAGNLQSKHLSRSEQLPVGNGAPESQGVWFFICVVASWRLDLVFRKIKMICPNWSGKLNWTTYREADRKAGRMLPTVPPQVILTVFLVFVEPHTLERPWQSTDHKALKEILNCHLTESNPHTGRGGT